MSVSCRLRDTLHDPAESFLVIGLVEVANDGTGERFAKRLHARFPLAIPYESQSLDVTKTSRFKLDALPQRPQRPAVESVHLHQHANLPCCVRVGTERDGLWHSARLVHDFCMAFAVVSASCATSISLRFFALAVFWRRRKASASLKPNSFIRMPLARSMILRSSSAWRASDASRRNASNCSKRCMARRIVGSSSVCLIGLTR